MSQITPPPWLMPHLEREWDNCWIFYRKGPDFTEEQYLELGGLTRGFLRTPHMSYQHEWIGVQIKVYKDWGTLRTPEY